MEIYESFVIAVLIFLSYYFIFVAQKSRIYASNTKQLEFLRKFQTLREVYYPSLFYFHGILQTIFGLLKRMKKRLPYTRQLFTLKDGGEIGLDFISPKQLAFDAKSDHLVIILPGLTSSSQTSYVKTLAIASAHTGASVVVINNRGLGGVPLKTPRTFCASNCDDVKEVLDYLYTKYPEKTKIAIGTSLGGIVLSHYMTKNPEEAKANLTSAVLISIVWNAHTATASIEKPITKYFVNYALAGSLKALVNKHRKMLENSWDISKILKTSETLREFDTNFTAPQFNYKTCMDYYDDVTVSTRIKDFPIPVYGLSAADDPMQPWPTLPYTEAEQDGSNLALIVTARGGHLGFLEGFLPISRPTHFSERFVHEFLTMMSAHH